MKMTTIAHASRDWCVPDNFPYSFDEWYGEASDNIDAACAHVAAFGCAVQAGGHVGVWPWLLAKRFAQVLTFEPDAENVRCAGINLKNVADNVAMSPKLLGDKVGRVSWHRDSDTGSHRVVDRPQLPTFRYLMAERWLRAMRRRARNPRPPWGRMKSVKSPERTTTKEMVTVDSLDLASLDLICLDIEGYEPFAIVGAQHTINRLRPVIMVEMRGHECKHGMPEFTTHNLLLDLGYSLVAESHSDRVYTPGAA